MYTVVSEVYQAQATGHRQEKDEGLKGDTRQKAYYYTYYYLLFFVYLLSRGCADCWL
jgi:hypothetical protein